METTLADASAGITELKPSPDEAIEAAASLEDLELAELVRLRRGERRVRVALDEL